MPQHAMPAPMKASTAASERFESRASPQMPWPLVQPLPRRVPNPTSRPAATSHGQGKPARGAATPVPATNHSAAPPIRPARKASRQL